MPLTIEAIVCVVDFSAYSRLMVAHAAALARRSAGHLFLVHVLHDPHDHLHPTHSIGRQSDPARLAGEARRHLAALMSHQDTDWEAVLRFGEPVEQIAAFVDTLPPSLVISASHGISPLRRLFIGTVVERLTRALSRPMLVVKPGSDDHGRGFGSVVVSCDSHGHWQRLAPLLVPLQPDADSQVHLVHALEHPAVQTVGDPADVSYAQAQQIHQDRLKSRLVRQAQRLFPHAGHLSVTVAPGVPQEMVLGVARDRAADLIVVGVRHSGPLGRWVAGSTTEALLRQAACCVLTVPEPSGSAGSGGERL